MCTPQSIIEQLGCRAFDEAVNAASKAGKYVLQYRTNLDKLRTEMRSLEDRRVIIERKVREANDRGEEIENAVSHWHTDADEVKNYVQDLFERSTAEAKMHCFACSCPNIKGRYRLSKQAEEKIADVKKLAQESHFDEISHPKPPPPELEFPSAENYVHLDSRTPIFEDIVGALKDPNVKMIGVYGLGGVGKTTLVEKVAKKMLDDGTFKQVSLVAVSKDLNVKDIQKKLADKLNLELKATVDENAIANQLWNKFKNSEKLPSKKNFAEQDKNSEKLYLVILDDIWEKVDLKAIGIPIADGTTGCKVVLTSRKEDLLRITMKADRNFPIAELPEEEGWNLFMKKVGNTIESRPEIDSLAREVCRKCKGLPVAINTLGAALEDRPYHTWKNALDKLERHMLTQIEGIDPSVWASLWVSFDMLRSPDAQSCFLLCCLFAEDVEIPIDELMRHCMARSLLAQNPRTFDEAKTAMCTVVDVLKSASLLSTGDHETVVKIHDVIRDVGISIAREKEAFLVDHSAIQWPRNPTNGPSYKAMSLCFKSIKGLPDGYPQLEALMVDDNSKLSDLEVPDNFFNMTMQLKVLTFTRMRMRRLPSSLAKLANLRMLNLNRCKLDDIAILKDLKSNLEVLSLRGSSIEALPSEIGQLTSLQVLDLRDCDKLMVIPRGVISNLTSLEELYFPKKFDKWEATAAKQQDTSSRENVSLEELRGLLSTGRLTTLHIHIPAVMLLPKEELIFANLKGFKISVGSKFEISEEISGRCMLKLEGIQLRNEFIPLVDKAEVVVVSKIEGLKKVFHDRGVGNRFLDLKYLKVTSCVEDLEYLLGEPKSSVQSHGLQRLQFNNLTVLIIEYCKSKYLFSPTTARGLVHLEELEVRYCEIMKGIVGFEGRNDEDEITSEVKLSKLKQLELVYLPNLLSFYAQKEKMGTTMGSSSACAQPLFSEKVIFPVLERLTIVELGNIIKIWDDQSIVVLEEQGSFCQLTDLEVKYCSELMHVFPSNMHPLLKNIERLKVYKCETLKGIAEFEGEIDEDGLRNEVAASLALKVEHLEITEIRDKQPLPGPRKGVESLCKLMDIRIKWCGQLLYVFPSHMLPQNLQELKIEGCDELEVIFSKDPKEEKEAINDDIIVFPRLKEVTLQTLRKLKSFYTETQGFFFSHKVIFPVLDSLTIDGLGNIIKIWDKQSIAHVLEEQGSFCQLKSVNVQKCAKLIHVFPSNMHPQLKNLEELNVVECETMKGIAEFEGEIDEDGLRNEFAASLALEVEHLEMVGVPKITEIRDKQLLPEYKKEVESLCKLMYIHIEKCGQLMYVFPSHMLPQNLQQLFIEECDELEVIFSKELKEKEAINNDIIVFPRLKAVTLKTLRKLKSFYTDTQGFFFSHKVIFPVLKKLSIQEVHKIIEIWDKQSIAVLEEQGSFCQLTDLDVAECEKLMHVFPSKMHSPLKNLKVLRVSDCPTMEGIVDFGGEIDEDGLRNEVCFSELSSLVLSSLPNLECCCTKLGKVGTTEGNSTINALPLFNGKVVFLVLKRMYLWDLNKITRIWDDQSLSEPEKEAKSFSELEDINVDGCDQLEYVFPSYMLPQLKNLQELCIRSCTKVEVIISNNPKEKEATNNNDTIRFPQLKTVKLWNLPNLKSFVCSDQTQLLFSNKVAFPVLERLYFVNLDKITRIWDNQPLSEPEKEAKSFCKLMVIIVYRCNQLEYVLPSYMLHLLKNLQELRIESCTKVEVIIISNNPKEKEATNNNDTIRFPQLKEVCLQELPNLKSFICSETQLFFSNKDAFPVLQNAYHLDRLFELLRNKTSTKEVSIEDAFPVLEDIKLDEDFEFLRNETSTKEVSIEECGTSGKESDYHGEELDEDLETPTKEECSTSGKENDHNGAELDEDLATPTKKVSMEECGTSGKENDHNGEQG